MKKRTYLVATMAAALVALVGCTKDFVAEAPKADAGLAERPEIGVVDLVVGQGTRVERDENSVSGLDWKWEADESVGALLVDEITAGKALKGHKNATANGLVKNGSSDAEWTYKMYVNNTPVKDGGTNYFFTNTYKDNGSGTNLKVKNDGAEYYTVVPNIYSNYPYNHVGKGAFTSEAKLVEGHYVFYAPYDEKHVTRQPLLVTLPAVQDVSDTYTAIDEFYASKTPVMLSMSYLSAANAGKQVATEMQPLFAYPKFTIVNKFKGFLFDGTKGPKDGSSKVITENHFISTATAAEYDMKLIKMEVYAGGTTDFFAYQRDLNPTAFTQPFTSKDSNGNELAWEKSATTYETARTSDVLTTTAYGETEYAFDEEDETMEFAAAFLTSGDITKATKRTVLDFGGKELKKGESYEFYAVMPAENYTTDGLFAILLVEIGGTPYYIWTNDVKGGAFDTTETAGFTTAIQVAKAQTGESKANFAYFATTGITDGTNYRFIDRYNHGSDNVTLVRGERWPTAEVNADRTAKDIKGHLLTVDLVGGMTQIALAALVEEEVEDPADKGIANNEEFLAYLNSIHYTTDAKEIENPLLNGTDDDDDTIPEGAEFFFAKENTVVINAELIDAIKNRIYGGSMTLTTNLPIANDVAVTEVKDASGKTEVTFKTSTSEYTIIYSEDAEIGDDATALTAGINKVEGGELAVAQDEDDVFATGVVVFITEGDATIAAKTAAGDDTGVANIASINLAEDVTLTVKTTFAGCVVGEEGSKVTIEKGANLTNANNVLDYVDNKALAAFGGKANTVNYTCFDLGISDIPAASKVNQVTVAPTTEKDIEVSDASIAFVKNLADGAKIIFGEKVTGLKSAKDVHLTNITAMESQKSTPLQWDITGGEAIAVYYTAPEEGDFFTNIEPISADAVSFVAE